MTQLPLFHSAPHRGVPTQAAAARSIEPHMGRLQGIVLDAIRASADGLTLFELSDQTGIRLQTCCARVNELTKAGRLANTGRTRRSPSGRASIVWEAK